MSGDATVTVRLFAAARAAAGGTAQASLPVDSLAQLRRVLEREHGPRMAEVLGACSYLVDGLAVPRGADALLPPGALVDVLPPFAGG